MTNLRKDEYGRMLCLFLAEGIRTRKVALKRAAEIAENVLKHINLVDSEHDFLFLVKELAKDFDELAVLEIRMARAKELHMKRDLELLVKDYVVKILPNDSQTALSILQDAAGGEYSLEKLKAKYPGFNPEELKR